VFGCCGFLSFSLVFCLFGGRLETTLYIHFTRRWVKSRRHSSAPREKKNKRAGKVRHSSQSGLWGVCGVYQQACPVDHLRLAYDWASPLSRNVYRLFAATSLRSAPAGTRRRLRPPLRLVYAGREAEKPNASVAAQILSHRLRQPVHEGCLACCRRFISLEMAVAPPAALPTSPPSCRT